MGLAIGIVKYLVFIVNLIFALFGFGLIVYGIVLCAQYSGQASLVPIVFGIIVFIISFLGCCGTIRESRCMLLTFAVILIVLFVISLILGAVCVAAGSGHSNCTENVSTLYNNYINNPDNSVDEITWESYQAKEKCCGYENYNDYTSSSLPPSCCGNDKVECSKDDPDMYILGCVTYCHLQWFMYTLGVIIILVGIVEITGSIFAICLAQSIQKQRRNRTFV